MIAEEIYTMSAVEVAQAVRGGKLSPSQVVSAHLERIVEVGTELNAFSKVRAHAAKEEALVANKRGKLAGVMVAVGDDIDMKGEMTRQGSQATNTEPKAEDNDLVGRLRQAGAVVVGKTRVSELGVWQDDGHLEVGRVENPWGGTSMMRGGQSGGASAVASNMAQVWLGIDGSGDVRTSAASAGVVALKCGSDFLPPPKHAWFGLKTFGVGARTTADLALVLEVLAGTRGGNLAEIPKTPLRIMVSTNAPSSQAKPSKAVIAALEVLAARLAGAGHTIIRMEVPYPRGLGWTFWRRQWPGVAMDCQDLNAKALEGRTRWVARLGRWLTQLGLARRADDELAGTMVEWFKQGDVLLSPLMTGEPESQAKSSWWRQMRDEAKTSYAQIWNLVDFPAASVPVGLDASGSPLGLQIVGVGGRERVILGLVAQIEELSPWPVLGIRSVAKMAGRQPRVGRTMVNEMQQTAPTKKVTKKVAPTKKVVKTPTVKKRVTKKVALTKKVTKTASPAKKVVPAKKASPAKKVVPAKKARARKPAGRGRLGVVR